MEESGSRNVLYFLAYCSYLYPPLLKFIWDSRFLQNIVQVLLSEDDSTLYLLHIIYILCCGNVRLKFEQTISVSTKLLHFQVAFNFFVVSFVSSQEFYSCWHSTSQVALCDSGAVITFTAVVASNFHVSVLGLCIHCLVFTVKYLLMIYHFIQTVTSWYLLPSGCADFAVFSDRFKSHGIQSWFSQKIVLHFNLL